MYAVIDAMCGTIPTSSSLLVWPRSFGTYWPSMCTREEKYCLQYSLLRYLLRRAPPGLVGAWGVGDLACEHPMPAGQCKLSSPLSLQALPACVFKDQRTYGVHGSGRWPCWNAWEPQPLPPCTASEPALRHRITGGGRERKRQHISQKRLVWNCASAHLSTPLQPNHSP